MAPSTQKHALFPHQTDCRFTRIRFISTSFPVYPVHHRTLPNAPHLARIPYLRIQHPTQLMAPQCFSPTLSPSPTPSLVAHMHIYTPRASVAGRIGIADFYYVWHRARCGHYVFVRVVARRNVYTPPHTHTHTYITDIKQPTRIWLTIYSSHTQHNVCEWRHARHTRIAFFVRRRTEAIIIIINYVIHTVRHQLLLYADIFYVYIWSMLALARTLLMDSHARARQAQTQNS